MVVVGCMRLHYTMMRGCAILIIENGGVESDVIGGGGRLMDGGELVVDGGELVWMDSSLVEMSGGE